MNFIMVALASPVCFNIVASMIGGVASDDGLHF